MEHLLDVRDLVQSFDLNPDLLSKITFDKGRPTIKERIVKAVNGISFSVKKGKVFSIVGESGCGKSTAARTVIKLIEPKSGSITYDGRDITELSREEMLPLRKRMQMIFQDPYASLNPRQRVLDILTEPMLFHRTSSSVAEAREKAMKLLKRVGIRAEQGSRYPHQFSGGQRQRIGIARALAVEPELIIADEPVSALDVSIQAQILNLLMDLKDELSLSYLFIAHDLSVVKHISDEIAVMYLGYIVEKGDKRQIFSNPSHPYTRALFSAIPRISGKTSDTEDLPKGEIPSAIDLPSGCPFHGRCKEAMPLCSRLRPEAQEMEPGHVVSCHLMKSQS
ncbi:ATP-binding cassette domain-containing protein [Dethiosulfovibrio sp. F2B]|uniref:ABC transporter ATP-binding protein n=1 Tax=Dethiosulfovibrio faecalis TaxID=2720018 RepID=UPI001F418835|nr:oligopeptide/dipeptide ABC transporter ATP-binding protein [Dethiosulfovibrio faecalis]MCF4152193.1 ATP-binding cassette domain-containing protein [Dethiosulfovibrio faecalis]